MVLNLIVVSVGFLRVQVLFVRSVQRMHDMMLMQRSEKRVVVKKGRQDKEMLSANFYQGWRVAAAPAMGFSRET